MDSSSVNYSGSASDRLAMSDDYSSYDEIIESCSEQQMETDPGFYYFTNEEKIMSICDYCNLTTAEFEVLSSNNTCPELTFPLMPLFSVLYSVVFLLGLAGNLLVLWTVVRGGRKISSVMHLFIGNLAFGDLLTVILCVPFTATAAIVINYWPFGYFLCVTVSYLQVRLNSWKYVVIYACIYT